jgi:hypothetical protein
VTFWHGGLVHTGQDSAGSVPPIEAGWQAVASTQYLHEEGITPSGEMSISKEWRGASRGDFARPEQ